MKKLLCIIGIIFATMMSTTAFAEMFSFQSVLGVNDISDIQSAIIVGDNVRILNRKICNSGLMCIGIFRTMSL